MGDRDELTPKQVAAMFDVSTSTVRRWETRKILVPARRLPGSRYRRYARADVEKLLAEGNPEDG